MFETLRAFMLRILRVPPEPEPPFGDPSSVRVFRASRKLYFLRLLRWGVTQMFAIAGIIFWFNVIAASKHEAARLRGQPPGAGSLATLPSGQNQVYLKPLRHVPSALFSWLWAAEALGLLVYAAQLLVTYAAVRLDYELRWYIVTDRSLRIRSGLFTVQEITMSYANLQQVVVSQGPLERLLGMSNVCVESAGGGSNDGAQAQGKTGGMHRGVFHGVENAAEIRDLILERLRAFRDTGLGDPDEPVSSSSKWAGFSHRGGAPKALEAGLELLSEARNLRKALAQRRTGM